jgi:uncharacterized protein (DUF1697 family)
MTRSVALLRGINVGGRTKVEMPRLRQAFEAIGCADVSTYINSGNVLFTDDRATATLVAAIEEELHRVFGLELRVVVRTAASLRAVCEAIPDDWTNDDRQKTDVLFLWDEVDDPSTLEAVAHDPELERVLYVPGALVWNIGREHVTRGNGVKLVRSELYRKMTVRNVNTVRKLDALAGS